MNQCAGCVDVVKGGGSGEGKVEETSRGLVLKGTRGRKLQVPVPLLNLSELEEHFTPSQQPASQPATIPGATPLETPDQPRHTVRRRLGHCVSAVSELPERAEEEVSGREGSPGPGALRVRRDF